MHAHRLLTGRLLMRAPEMTDAPAIQQLVSAYEIARSTLHIPHPYPEDGAVEWLKRIEAGGDGAHLFALIRRSDSAYIGTMGLHIYEPHQRAEVGYWVGVPYWNQGYATEALTCLLEFGFETIGLQRIFAQYYTDNPASRYVMEKSGMLYEGCMRQHIRKWDQFKDVGICGILRSDWEQR
jgi:RimJ/RimL family protein N-acetyltransferase